MKNLAGSKTKISPGSPDHAAILNSLPEEVSEVASSLLPEDLEILAYLIACPSQTRASTHHTNSKSNKKVQLEGSCSKPPPSLCKSVSFQLSDDPCKSSSSFSMDVQLRKPALFCCNCFQCYTSYWSRWDASPNRGKIDEAIALYEDHIDRKSKKHNKGCNDSKGEKRHEGKGRGRKSHKEHKQKEVKAPAKAEKEKTSRTRSTDSVAAVPSKDQCSELLLLVETKAVGIKEQNQEEQKESSTQESSSLASDVDALNATGISQQERPSSFLKSPSRNHGRTQGSKEKFVMKEVKVKTSRVAPFVGEGAMADQNDNTCLDSSDLDSDEDDSTTLHRGRKLMSFVASRLWGFWDRRVQTKVVDVY